jgi:hypothetical protein
MRMPATATNVIPISEKTGYTVPTEQKLVRKCIECAAAMAASDACYRIDPDENNSTASAIGGDYCGQASELLAQIAKMPARTADGIQAKARLAGVVFESASLQYNSPEDEELDFLRSFAVDVERYFDAARKAARS